MIWVPVHNSKQCFLLYILVNQTQFDISQVLKRSKNQLYSDDRTVKLYIHTDIQLSKEMSLPYAVMETTFDFSVNNVIRVGYFPLSSNNKNKLYKVICLKGAKAQRFGLIVLWNFHSYRHPIIRTDEFTVCFHRDDFWPLCWHSIRVGLSSNHLQEKTNIKHCSLHMTA